VIDFSKEKVLSCSKSDPALLQLWVMVDC